ncbi:uncharacterized protein LOC128256705 [Drosophila gunungcola]|uniref:uncharacterized protein LOC128256705 n=1 Tax=Drosophila gunungcola TaxID=103775 RepID=UPI0022E30469|nr:uncharacterized protein LOC128256705 [Drosophila gunungcola]
MEIKAQPNNSSPNSNSKPCEAPVLNISGKVEPKQNTPRNKCIKQPATVPSTIVNVPEPPKINPKSFPVIIGRVLLKTNDQPAVVPKINLADFEQNLCLLSLEKPADRKRVYHMFVSNEKELEKDCQKVRKMYENRKDIRIVDQMILYTLCARSLYHRVQNKLTDVEWNKQRNIFETDKNGEKDIWKLSQKLYELENEERAKLFNYAKFLSATNS